MKTIINRNKRISLSTGDKINEYMGTYTLVPINGAPLKLTGMAMAGITLNQKTRTVKNMGGKLITVYTID